MKTESPRQTTERAAEGRPWVGMNWIRQEKRLAIYLRDGLSCAWCGDSIESGAQLTLDHITPWSKGGVNAETNLITACERCNKSRGNRTVQVFARAVAEYLDHGIESAAILSHVRACASRSLQAHLEEAKTLIARRGSAAKVLAGLS